MKKLWNKFADNFFSKIKIGTLEVVFKDKTTKLYGEKKLEDKITLEINSNRFFIKTVLYGDIGFAESFIDRDFETSNLTKLIELALLNSKYLGITSENEKRKLINLMPFFNRFKHSLRRNSKTNARKNISAHYDLSNDFYKLMLDKTMMYSSAVFENKDQDLYDAQKNKLEKLSSKLNIKDGSKVLEIGSGWGAMAIHLAKDKKCDVTTVTLSVEQKKLCKERFKKEGIEDKIDILLKDYRDLKGEFDAIIAVEMFEAVGREYFHIFFKKCQELLKPSGVLVLQVITIPDQRYKAYSKGSDFIQKYIFPGGHLPSILKILETTSKHTRLNLNHLEEFTEHYAKTLNIWHENFENNLDEVKKLGFDDYFIRMWKMYLNYCEAGFLTRNINLHQLVFTRDQNIYLNKGLIA
ncbi:SAM-dependent methyltransferase [Aliarcobacter skirrowii]|uniref:Class I SAM-dependent methyltransferase n=1 Tax=Aliarcobacter skirrowii CCUG 10374 TaxID=1032239 RepID=A0AAD0SLB3_9BACT|nr:cyclopropane-fatty-acyl-phospholipid synthase family protein [Aliarcobacter skirrowii]AXX84859.1 cyclopropane fatty acyl phospholipid synthase [Aliarcobacter skirrowii CCUG 10374]KAB0620435.1 class I SAM-dependent methyltransferase [Aliarcobacter skirrowii CCUG 10374]RXI25626.1 class I SAM-dependent methyltransferase [Aliarcobacter skirrowii CCUG 10374]SUU96618.1 Cyclopropane-fatty-acyl-phospholipid synthase [Aliarcobacter skirrowii]HAC71343.1 class I SAM-dependent methyltransferase [Aliarc